MIRREISHIVHPRSVNLIKLDGYKVDEDSIRSVTGFIILYVLILLGSFMLVSLDNFDFITNVTAVTTCLSNVGPGLAMAGPVENLSFFAWICCWGDWKFSRLLCFSLHPSGERATCNNAEPNICKKRTAYMLA